MFVRNEGREMLNYHLAEALIHELMLRFPYLIANPGQDNSFIGQDVYSHKCCHLFWGESCSMLINSSVYIKLSTQIPASGRTASYTILRMLILTELKLSWRFDSHGIWLKKEEHRNWSQSPTWICWCVINDGLTKRMTGLYVQGLIVACMVVVDQVGSPEGGLERSPRLEEADKAHTQITKIYTTLYTEQLFCRWLQVSKELLILIRLWSL